MAGRGSRRREQRLPQSLVALGVAVVALTGVWLWWLGEASTLGTFEGGDLDEPFTLQRWLLRAHVVGSVLVLLLIVGLVAQAILHRQVWRIFFRGLFGLLLIAGLYTGFEADWDGARLWAANIGSHIQAFVPLGSGPTLPDNLARGHLAVVPAMLVVIAIVSSWYDRRS